MRVTLGGDRLGSGKRMKVEIEGYGRSTHDLSTIRRTTMSAGTLVPFLNLVGLPGDSFDIDLDVDVKTHPTIGPLFGSYKVQLDVFKSDMRLYQGLLHTNEVGLGMKMDEVFLPVMEFEVPLIHAGTFSGDYNNATINPSNVLAHLGLSGLGQAHEVPVTHKRTFNATSWLNYWDIYKNYYANKPEGQGRFIHTDNIDVIETVDTVQLTFGIVPVYPPPPGSPVMPLVYGETITVQYTGARPDLSQILFVALHGPAGAGLPEVTVSLADIGYIIGESAGVIQIFYNWSPGGASENVVGWRYILPTDQAFSKMNIVSFQLEDLDKMRRAIMAWPFTNPNTPFVVTSQNLSPFVEMIQIGDNNSAITSNQEGLAIKTYQSDLFNNWLNAADIEAINTATSIDTSGGSFTMNSLNLAEKMFNLENRILASGGTYDDWKSAVWGMEIHSRSEIPVYVGGLSRELVFEEVISTAESAGDAARQPLGTLAGKGRMSDKKKGGRVSIKCDEACVIMGIISLTPRVDYSQGNDWTFGLTTLDDLHKPEYDGIGFQDFIQERFAWWTTKQAPTGEWEQMSQGKQPAWIEYQTAVNTTKGNFAMVDNEMFMTLNRRYGYEAPGAGPYFELIDPTAYVDPEKFNWIFAETALDSQNFWVNIGCNIEARRVMSAKIMPNM